MVEDIYGKFVLPGNVEKRLISFKERILK